MTENRKAEENQTQKKDPLLLSSYDIGFNTRICVYIPSRDREGSPLPVWTHEDAINHYKMLFSSLYGGYTMDRGSVGGWYSEEQKKLIEEDIIKIYSYTSDFEENEKKLMKEIKRSVYILNQSCVTLEINNKMYFIDNKEEERHPVLDPEPEPEEPEEEPEPEEEDEDEEINPIIDNDIYENHAEYTEHKKKICNDKKIYDLSSIYNNSELKEAETGDIFEEWNGYNRQYYKVISFTNCYFRYKRLHNNNIICRYEPSEEGQNRYDILNNKSILYHIKNTNITQFRRKKGIIRAVKKQYIINDKFICDTYYNN